MFVLILQTLVLMAIAVFLGCLFGYWLRIFLRRWNGGSASTGRASAVSAANAARVATSGELAAQVAKVQRVFSPEPLKEPESAKPAEPARAVPVEASSEPAAATAAPRPATKPARKAAAKTPRPAKAAKPKAAKAEKVVKPAEVKSDTPPAAVKSRPGEAPKPAKAARTAKASDSAKPSAAAMSAAKAAKPKAARAEKATKPATAKAAAPAAKDDLKLISGIGRQNEAKLNAAGITAFSQIAALTKKQQAEMGEMLAFPGRMEREDWVGQAKVLAKGGKTAFAKRVAEGDVPSSASPAKAAAAGKKPASRKKS